MYFECNLPLTVPSYIHATKTADMERLFQAVHDRMDKLEDALALSGLDGATFAEYAKVLFDNNKDRFETMTSDELAEYAALVHRPGYKAKDRLTWPNATVLVDCAFLTTKEWEAVRHIGIGGSDAAVCQNASPYKTGYGLWHDKCWTPKSKEETGKQAIFDRGHYMEGKVIQAFCELAGAEVIPETRMFQSKQYPAAIADVDAVLRFPDGNIYVFEAKTTVAENYLAWSGGKIPPQYLPQTRQYPAVLDDPRIKGTFIGCLFTNDVSIRGTYVGSDYDKSQFVYRKVERDADEETYVLSNDQAFYDTNLVGGVIPALTGNAELNKKVLAEVVGTPDPDAEPVALPSTASGIISDYLALKGRKDELTEQIKPLEKAMEAKSVELIAMLGSSVEGRLDVPDGEDGEYWEVKYSPRGKTDVDMELLEAIYPDAYAACVEVNPCHHRVFSLKAKKPKAAKKPTKKRA